MAGHLLEYHPAVRKLKELLDAGELGRILYVYANRLNLGKVRPDENALWCLGPHDISVIHFLTGEEPEEVSARGECYLQQGVEDVVFGYIRFPSGMIGHLHVSWLDPHKTRKITVVGSDKMAVFDDMDADRKVTVYDKSAVVPRYQSYGEYVTLRFGDIHIPHLANDEPLRLEVEHFVDCVRDDRTAAVGRSRRPERGARARGHGALAARRRPAGQDRRPHGRLVAVALHPSELGPQPAARRQCERRLGVVFGANVVVYDDTEIGDGCFIQDGAVLGKVPSLSPSSTAKRGELAPLRLGAGLRRLDRGDRLPRRDAWGRAA